MVLFGLSILLLCSFHSSTFLLAYCPALYCGSYLNRYTSRHSYHRCFRQVFCLLGTVLVAGHSPSTWFREYGKGSFCWYIRCALLDSCWFVQALEQPVFIRCDAHRFFHRHGRLWDHHTTSKYELEVKSTMNKECTPHYHIHTRIDLECVSHRSMCWYLCITDILLFYILS